MKVELDEYFKALARLESNVPEVLPIGSPINNDNVSLEAGRKRGSIKKSRESFGFLISEIERAKREKNVKNKETDGAIVAELREQVELYKKLYEDALSRELSLVAQIFDLKYHKKVRLTIVK